MKYIHYEFMIQNAYYTHYKILSHNVKEFQSQINPSKKYYMRYGRHIHLYNFKIIIHINVIVKLRN